MRIKVMVIILICALAAGCKKKNESCPATAIITDSAPGCSGWGIIVNGVKYPSSNIPANLQQPGIFVCVDYELYQDMRLCACCGGTWANIKSIRYLAD